MNCERIQELYTDYYEKAISGSLLEAAEHHFKVCTDCRTDYAKFAMAMQLLDVELPEVEVPASFRADILTKIEAQPRKQSAAEGIFAKIREAFSAPESRFRYQMVSGFAVAAVVIAAVVFSNPSLFKGSSAVVVPPIISPPPAAADYTGMFRSITSETRSDARTYHDFNLHLPAGQVSGTMDAYVIQDDKPLTDDSVLTDYSSVTPIWSDSKSLDSEHSLNVPVAVVSDVPAGTTLTFMVKDTDAAGIARREAAFVPVNAAGTWNAVALTQGTSLFNTLQTVAAAGSVPVVLDNSVITAASGTKLATFLSAPVAGGEVSEFEELRIALSSDPSLQLVDKGTVYAVVLKPGS